MTGALKFNRYDLNPYIPRKRFILAMDPKTLFNDKPQIPTLAICSNPQKQFGRFILETTPKLPFTSSKIGVDKWPYNSQIVCILFLVLIS